MIERRSYLFGVALMLVATALVLLLRTVAQSESRPRARASAAEASHVIPSSAPTSSPTLMLEVRVESPCRRLGKLEFALAPMSGTGTSSLERSAVDGARWDDVAAGDYELSVSGAGWKPHRQHVRLSEDSPRALVVPLEPSRFVRGRVVTREATEGVRRFALRAEARAATPAGRVEPLGERIEIADSEDGAFCIGGVPLDAAEVRVFASAPGFADGDTGWLRLGASESLSDLVIELVRSAQ